MKTICIGFCSQKPCNCKDIMEVQDRFRQDMLKCAINRENGLECTCIRPCFKDADYWRNQIQEQTFENWYEINYRNEIKEKQKYDEIRKKVNKELQSTQYRWITITLPKEYTPLEVHKKMSSLVKNKPFRNHAYCYEFTGKEAQYHPHIHFLYEKFDKPNRDDKAICRKFNIKDNFIHKMNINENNLNEKLQYIFGNKQEDKLEQVELDTIILRKNNLKKYYIQNIDAPQRKNTEIL